MNEALSNGQAGSEASYPVVTTTFLQGISDQSAAAWKKLVRIYGPVVFHWCRQKGASDEDAADIGQEVFRAVLTGIHRFERSNQSAFQRWLKTITRNKICDYWRRRSHVPEVIGGTDFQEIVHQLPASSGTVNQHQHDAQSIVARCTLEELKSNFNQKTWSAFWETSVNNRVSSEVAQDLGMTPMAVRKAKSRVLRQLRQELASVVELNFNPVSNMSHVCD